MPLVSIMAVVPAMPVMPMIHVVVVESQHLGHVGFVFLQILEQPFIREIEWMRVLPVLVDHLLNTLDNRFVMDLDGQFTTAVKTARSKICLLYTSRCV